MARRKTPVSEYKKLMLRLPEEVHTEVQRIADKNDRSLNAQIVHSLKEACAKERPRRVIHTPAPALVEP